MSVLSFRACRGHSLCGSALAAALGVAAGAARKPSFPRSSSRRRRKKKSRSLKPRAGACRSASSACASTGGARYTAGQSGRRDREHPQPGTEYDLCADRHHSDDHQSRHDPGAARRRQSNGRKDTPAGPWRDAGLAASGSFHVRNEHANVQVRINGIMLPDGVTGFGTFLDTALIGNMTLITGALPAQFGLRTSGVLDIQTRNDAFNGGTVGVYGGTGKPSRRASNMAARSVRPSISSLGGSSRAISAWKIRRRTGRRSTTTRRRSVALPMSRPFSIPIRASR